MILLLLNNRNNQAKIANFLGCIVNKVFHWCIQGYPENLDTYYYFLSEDSLVKKSKTLDLTPLIT